MRILILNQFFYPDPAATSQLLTDLARSLAASGHSIRVICGRCTYTGSEHQEQLDPPPVEVVRTVGMPFARTRLGRILSYASYLCAAAVHSMLYPRADLVLTLTTPPGLSLIGSLMKMIYGARHFIWEMDVYPDIAVDLEVIGAHTWVARLVGLCLDFSRRKADGIIALSKTMRSRMTTRGIPPRQVYVAENWADGEEIQPKPFPEWHPLRILYSGNFGLAHDVKTIRAAIERFASDHRFHFAFTGSGSQLAGLEELRKAKAISNLSFTGYCSRRELSNSLGGCHIGLVTQKAATIGSIVPSKTYGIMAAGRPILYIGPKGAEPAQIIERFGCGWQVDPGDSASLIDLLEHLAVNPAEIVGAGARGREAFLRYYDKPIAVARICSILGLERAETIEGAILATKEQTR